MSDGGGRQGPGVPGTTSTSGVTAAVAIRVSRYPLYVLMAILALDQADRYLLSAVFPLIKQQFRVSDAELGLLSAAFLVVAAVGAVPFGILVDRLIRTRIIAWGVAAWGAAMVLTGLASSYAMLFLSRMCLGIAEPSYSPASFSLLTDYYPVKERGRILGIYAVGGTLGFASLPIGGLLADKYGWRAAFHFYGFLGFVLAMVVWSLREPPRGESELAHHGLVRVEDQPPPASSRYARLNLREALQLILHTPSVGLALIAQGLSTFFLAGWGIWLTTFFVRYHGMSVATASGATAFLAIAAIGGSVGGGIVGDRLVKRGIEAGRVYVVGLSTVVTALFLFPAMATPSTSLMLLLFFVGAIALNMPAPVIAAIIADVVHPDLRGRAQSTFTLINTGAAAVSPLLIGVLSDHIGLRASFLTLMPLVVVGGLLMLLFGRRHIARDTARMHELLVATSFEDASGAVPARAG